MDKREASGGEWASTLPCRMISGPYDPPGAGEVLVEGMTAMSLCIATFWEQQLCTRERSCSQAPGGWGIVLKPQELFSSTKWGGGGGSGG